MKSFRLFTLVLAGTATLSACDKPNTHHKADAPVAQVEHTNTQAPDLTAETTAYQMWAQGQVEVLLADTQRFVDLLNDGKLAEAKALYPLARMPFERIEPVAEIFGDLDPRIDNREADLQADETWSGFHAIEKILWTQNTTEGTKQLAEQLIFDIKELRDKLPQANITGELMIQGSVDLLNEISTTKITGEEEIFSHTDLYDFQANIEGADKIFEILTPKINEKDANLVKTLREKFDDVYKLLNQHRIGEKDFKPFDQLSQSQTKELAEAVNKLGEPLAQMGIILK